MKTGNKKLLWALPIGGAIVVAIIVLGTIIMGQNAKRDTDSAVRSVSLLYLDELAGRREQVVANNLNDNIEVIHIAISLMTEEDLSDLTHLQAYQKRMKTLFNLEKFAFVDQNGLIYTSTGTQTDIDLYRFDYRKLTEPEILIKDVESAEKKVIIAVPVENLVLNGEKLTVCFMEINMQVMLKGLSMHSQNSEATFSNIYTSDGIPLSNTVLGGLAEEDNLLEAMRHASFDKGYSYEKMEDDFKNGRKGVVSFTYNDTKETLSYVPVDGTDWFLTYLIRDSVISEQIKTVSDEIIRRSLFQSILTALVLIGLFAVIIVQTRKSAKATLEKETAEAENRIKQQELEEKLALQNQLLMQERQNETLVVLHDMLRSGPWFMDYDEQGKMISVTWSDTFRKMLGYTGKDDFPDKLESWSDLLHEEDRERVLKEFNDTVNDYTDRKIYDVEYRLLTKDQGWRWFHTIGKPSRRPDGSPITYIGIFVDVTRQKEMERIFAEQQEALKTALQSTEEANKAKTAFLSNMSHEIRTPMNAIIGLDNIALNDPDISEKTREYLTKIGASADHLLKLINDILDMSRIESGRMTLKNEEFSFPKLLETINTMFSGQCQDKGLEYHCHINGHIDNFYIGDNMKLRQVLINILGNAVKFTPEGGKVEMTIERTAQFENYSTLTFRIADTGIGMSSDYLPHIFEAFSQEDSSTTNKYGSSGLGMAITKNIVEMMNGAIQVTSEKGKGTNFTVTVTLMDSARKGNEEGGNEIHLSEMTVLIVDDDPVACEHARLVLENAGIASEIASSGHEAVEMVKLRHARMAPYNLILIDWKMPGMDGVETAKQIRSLIGDESAIIILTAYRWDDVLEEAMHAGVDSFIPKPLFAATVIEEFCAAVKKKELLSGKKKKATDLTGKHILIAEDVAINAEIMVMILQMRQIETDLAENGRIAVEKFRERPVGYYDAILMDMRMPEMDGLEATRTIRAMDREDAKTIPIIALTANAFDEDVQRSLQAGLNAHLSKPVQPESLFETLENLIKE